MLLVLVDDSVLMVGWAAARSSGSSE